MESTWEKKITRLTCLSHTPNQSRAPVPEPGRRLYYSRAAQAGRLKYYSRAARPGRLKSTTAGQKSEIGQATAVQHHDSTTTRQVDGGTAQQYNTMIIRHHNSTGLSLPYKIWTLVRFRTYALKQDYFGMSFPYRFHTDTMAQLSTLGISQNISPSGAISRTEPFYHGPLPVRQGHGHGGSCFIR